MQNRFTQPWLLIIPPPSLAIRMPIVVDVLRLDARHMKYLSVYYVVILFSCTQCVNYCFINILCLHLFWCRDFQDHTYDYGIYVYVICASIQFNVVINYEALILHYSSCCNSCNKNDTIHTRVLADTLSIFH